MARAMQVAPSLYLLLRDSLYGQSAGKLLAGIQVIEIEEGRPASAVDSIARNAWLALAPLPWVGPPILIVWGAVVGAQIVLGAPQRFGEGFAATRVVVVTSRDGLRPGSRSGDYDAER